VPGLVYRYTERPCITTLTAQTIFMRVSQQIQCITSGSINQFVWLFTCIRLAERNFHYILASILLQKNTHVSIAEVNKWKPLSNV